MAAAAWRHLARKAVQQQPMTVAHIRQVGSWERKSWVIVVPALARSARQKIARPAKIKTPAPQAVVRTTPWVITRMPLVVIQVITLVTSALRGLVRTVKAQAIVAQAVVRQASTAGQELPQAIMPAKHNAINARKRPAIADTA